MRRRDFNPQVRDFKGAIVWLRDHGLEPTRVAGIFDITVNKVNVAFFRDKVRLVKRSTALLKAFDNRVEISADKNFFEIEHNHPKIRLTKRVRDLEDAIEQYGRRFWQGVRFLNGTPELGRLLRAVSQPAADNIPLLRVLARLHHLECETYLHAGYALSAMDFGLKAYGYSEYIYKHTRSSVDLERLAKTVLLISNSCISRRDMKRAQTWLKIADQAFIALSRQSTNLDPEYHRQLASAQRFAGEWSAARTNLLRAENLLTDFKDTPTKAAVKDMGDRVLNVIAATPKWDDSQELLQLALREWPEYDSHRASNVNWTAACGFITDSLSAHRQASDLLEKYKSISQGFGLQSSGAYLLSLTPHIPRELRVKWVFFALSYNAYRDK